MRSFLFAALLFATPALADDAPRVPPDKLARAIIDPTTQAARLGVVAEVPLIVIAEDVDRTVRFALYNNGIGPSPRGCPTNDRTAPAMPGVTTASCIIAIGQGALLSATNMQNTIAVGRCSGAALTNESDDLLVGDYTSAPKGRNGFVNIANAICFWRDSGEKAECPAPEPECAPQRNDGDTK